MTAGPARPLAALTAALRDEGGLLAAAVGDPKPTAEARLGALAAGGPRAHAAQDAYAEIVEAVYEGHLVHTSPAGRARIVSTPDEDLALLAGDRLYALGLSRLADLGDLDAVAELADVIVLGAQAQATRDPELAAAAFQAGAAAVGFGSSEALRAAKDAARSGDPSAPSALRAAARQLARTGANTPRRRIP